MKSSAREKVDRYQWHRWFAWYPVKIGQSMFWLETVERRRVPGMVGTGDMDGVEYRKPISSHAPPLPAPPPPSPRPEPFSKRLAEASRERRQKHREAQK